MDNEPPERNERLKQVRILLWIMVAVAIIGIAALLLFRREGVTAPRVNEAQAQTVQASIGGPFTLTAADGKPFSSRALAGKPYAIFFGFTRCGDVCPTTLARLVKLREQAGGADALNIVFVTIDPANDGPKEVGQYATLFNSPIIGLTGTQPQIDQVKKQYGIHAQPVAHAPAGQEMEHSSTVLLFDRDGRLASTLATQESEQTALDKFRSAVA